MASSKHAEFGLVAELQSARLVSDAKRCRGDQGQAAASRARNLGAAMCGGQCTIMAVRWWHMCVCVWGGGGEGREGRPGGQAFAWLESGDALYALIRCGIQPKALWPVDCVRPRVVRLGPTHNTTARTRRRTKVGRADKTHSSGRQKIAGSGV